MHVIKLLSMTFELVFQNHPIRTLYTLDTEFWLYEYKHQTWKFYNCKARWTIPCSAVQNLSRGDDDV